MMRKIAIDYSVGGTAMQLKYIADDATWEKLKEDFANPALEIVETAGRINDIDGNRTESMIRREDISAIDSMSVNGIAE